MGCCLIAAARHGATLVFLEEPNPFVLRRGRALELLEREQVTVFPGVPFNFRHLADAPTDADLSALRLCFSAGTALPRETFDAFLDRFGIPVRQLYGCTEAGTLTADRDPEAVPELGRHAGRGRAGPDRGAARSLVSSPAADPRLLGHGGAQPRRCSATAGSAPATSDTSTTTAGCS